MPPVRRGPLQRKVRAVTLTPAEFEARVKSGLVRHVGLPEYLSHMLATRLGWQLDKMDDFYRGGAGRYGD